MAAIESEEPIAVWAVIYDAEGRIVYRVAAQPGDTRSARPVLLAPGDYRLEFHAKHLGAAELPEIKFSLLRHTISFPIGPGLVDPTDLPFLARR